MNRLGAAASFVVTMASLTLAAACGGKVVFVEDGDGSGGGTGGTGGDGGTGPVTATNASVTSTTGPQSSVAVTATSVSTGPMECATCSDYIQGIDTELPLCPGSAQLYEDFVNCVCFEDCAMSCGEACNGAPELPPECEDCIYGPCGPTLDACFNDI